ncbi:hypothetical protein [Acinetobacter sp. TG19627]|uniref:Uncharacterized protein n=2 Tax=Acinetobacter higginsii TaxID=70347 RepID=N9RI62_9GAMM|nr:hypothetical protein [Acinetobacter sp. TG19627]ENX57644.1 hypothetical protein F902_02041 [Acinetobacter higginsii]
MDEIFCHTTGQWHSAKYWFDNQMNPNLGTPLDHLFGAFHSVQKIMFIGGASDGRLMYFKNDQDIVRMPHPKPLTPIHDYSKFREYATEMAKPTQEPVDTYLVEVFRFNNTRRKFLILSQLNNKYEQLLKHVQSNWQYGYRL